MLQLLLKPVSNYSSWNHDTKIYGTSKCLDNPLNIIKNAYNMNVDTTQWQNNRNNFSRLYQSLRNAYIPHQDMVIMCGNPYITTMQNWRNISYSRQQIISREYPEMPHIATTFNDWLKKQAQLCKFASERNGQCDDAFPDVVAAYTFVKTAVTSGVSGLSTYAKNLFKTRQITKTIEKNATKIEKVLLSFESPKMIRHHLFNRFWQQTGASQKYRAFFKKHKINVDDYCVELPRTTHINRIHQKQNDWTNRWKNWIDAHPNATTKEVYQFAGKLMDEYGISHVSIIKYRK